MGEAKRRRLVDEVTKRLVDEGKLIEAGWQGLRLMAVSSEASEVQLRELRMAFFAGAQHLFGSIMSFMEEGSEATDADMQRMEAVDAELEAFIAGFKLRHGVTLGSG